MYPAGIHTRTAKHGPTRGLFKPTTLHSSRWLPGELESLRLSTWTPVQLSSARWPQSLKLGLSAARLGTSWTPQREKPESARSFYRLDSHQCTRSEENLHRPASASVRSTPLPYSAQDALQAPPWLERTPPLSQAAQSADNFEQQAHAVKLEQCSGNSDERAEKPSPRRQRKSPSRKKERTPGGLKWESATDGGIGQSSKGRPPGFNHSFEDEMVNTPNSTQTRSSSAFRKPRLAWMIANDDQARINLANSSMESLIEEAKWVSNDFVDARKLCNKALADQTHIRRHHLAFMDRDANKVSRCVPAFDIWRSWTVGNRQRQAIDHANREYEKTCAELRKSAQSKLEELANTQNVAERKEQELMKANVALKKKLRSMQSVFVQSTSWCTREYENMTRSKSPSTHKVDDLELTSRLHRILKLVDPRYAPRLGDTKGYWWSQNEASGHYRTTSKESSHGANPKDMKTKSLIRSKNPLES
eukprot:GEMP01040950.1.p1 GENE.GEMP01040950.1~~GEMP01040950.1.p1  ORF type:complete len:475 (+),score=85.52 GEMP01040950.1:57-1481(+)